MNLFDTRGVRILVRGGGDLASGAILRLMRAGWQVLLVELPHPLAVRRMVSFSQAIYEGEVRVEDVVARRVDSLAAAQPVWQAGALPVLVDPQAVCRYEFHPHVLLDARMRKRPLELGADAIGFQADAAGLRQGAAPLVIGLGPGFQAGLDCHAVIETNRGPFLGRVIWDGSAEADTGVPEGVSGISAERVLRAPLDGVLRGIAHIGDRLQPGDLIAEVEGVPITAPFAGVLRGLVQSGLVVRSGEKIGDLDPRNDPRLCWLVSDKALSVGGGVLEAILSFPPFCRPTRSVASRRTASAYGKPYRASGRKTYRASGRKRYRASDGSPPEPS